MNLHNGDCLEVLKSLESDSLDSMVTDPPAGISFMGKAFDSDRGGRDKWIAWLQEIAEECLRVLKPGAHGLVWALPRTSHWTAFALEKAGFEIREIIHHLFGSGFPKSSNISKQLEKMNLPEEAKIWKGYGSATKPAAEHWILIRKPLGESTIARNVLKHGTGGLNIDASRISIDSNDKALRLNNENHKSYGTTFGSTTAVPESCFKKDMGLHDSKGRFPANLILSHHEDCVEVGVKEVKAITGGTNPIRNKRAIQQWSADENLPFHYGENGKETVADWQCHEVTYFDASRANEALYALTSKGFLGSQADCQFYHDFYGELFRLIEADDLESFPTPRDVRAFVGLFLSSLIHSQHHPLSFHLSSLGDFLQHCKGYGIPTSKSFAEAFEDQSFCHKLCSLYRESSLKQTNSMPSNNRALGDNDGTPGCISYTLDQWLTLGSLSICLAQNHLQDCYITDRCPVKELDRQSGPCKKGGFQTGSRMVTKGTGGEATGNIYGVYGGQDREPDKKQFDGDYGASRFFYCAKASKRDRGEGNIHPTVKSTKLMSYLITLVTPPGGVVLDPFAGSFSTGVAAVKGGFGFVGIEKEQEYFLIGEARMKAALALK